MKALIALTLLLGMNFAVYAGDACCGKKAKESSEKKACTECTEDSKCEKCTEKKAEAKN